MKKDLFNEVNGFILLLVLFFFAIVNIMVLIYETKDNYVQGYGAYILWGFLIIASLLGIISSIFICKNKK